MLKLYNKFTNRAVLYVGFLCNLKCVFCYYGTRPDKQWHTLDKCKEQANIFRHKYNNRFVDITGGEPTLYPDIVELVKYCRDISLKPTIITNMQLLVELDRVKELQDAGVEDFLCSIHGLYDQHDKTTGVCGSFSNAERALKNINFLKIPFRTNVVINFINYKNLRSIAEFVNSVGCRRINFISCNTFGAHEVDFEPRAKFSEIKPYLHDALNYCDSEHLQASVRYVPFCFMDGQESKCYNFFQLPYDCYEWDCKSWLSRDSEAPDVGKISSDLYKSMTDEEAYKFLSNSLSKHDYIHPPPCNNCCLFGICDGLHKRYVDTFGDSEINPREGMLVHEPDFFLKKK